MTQSPSNRPMTQTVLLLLLLASPSLASRPPTGPQEATLQAPRPPAHPPGKTRGLRTSQRLVCYDRQGYSGDELQAVAPDYWPDLGAMDDRIESCCFTGIWILYADENYNTASPGSANWFGYGADTCFNAPEGFRNHASSLRYTGAPDDMYHDTVNIYFNEYFNGDEEYTYHDAPQLNYDNRAQSIVVTGCSAA